MFAAILKVATFVASLVGIFAQVKGRGGSTLEAVAETATGAVAGAATLQMSPLKFGKTETK